MSNPTYSQMRSRVADIEARVRGGQSIPPDEMIKVCQSVYSLIKVCESQDKMIASFEQELRTLELLSRRAPTLWENLKMKFARVRE